MMDEVSKLGILATNLMILENLETETEEEKEWLNENIRITKAHIKIVEERMDRMISMQKYAKSVEERVIQCQHCQFGYNGNGNCEIKHYFTPDGFCSKAQPIMPKE